MNLFQLTVLTGIGLLLVWGTARLALRKIPRRLWLLRSLVALLTALAVARPDWMQLVATKLGIGRGADVVLYLFVFAFLMTTLFFYSRFLSMEQALTQLVRLHAIENAQRGQPPSENVAEYEPMKYS